MYAMKRLFFFLFLLPLVVFSQDWIIIDVLEQSNKKLEYRIDNGEEVLNKTVKNPSIVYLINEYASKGYLLKHVTQGVELDLNGTFPLLNNLDNNFGVTNLNLSNNNRVMLWFRKREH